MGNSGYARADDRPGGGCSVFRKVDLNATGRIAKATPGRLYGWYLSNTGVAVAYVKLYDKATAPTSADTPVLTIPVAAGGFVPFQHPVGLSFSAGISARAVTGVADNDNTGAGSNEVIAQLFYA
jgi:hypothetical protein